MLKAVSKGKYILAHEATKGPEYRCPECNMILILRKGRLKIAHFAHKPPVFCSWGKGETEAHMKAKNSIKDEFIRRGLRAEVEYEVKTLPGDRRADVMLWSRKGEKVAIEIQHTPLGLDAIEERTKSYLNSNIRVLWVSLIKPKFFDPAEQFSAQVQKIERYSPKAYERWTHGYNFGRIIYYDPTTKEFWLGRFLPHSIYVESSEWYTSNGEHRTAGGYTRTSKRWKNLHLVGPISLKDFKIRPEHRQQAVYDKYNFPGGPWVQVIHPLSDVLKEIQNN